MAQDQRNYWGLKFSRFLGKSIFVSTSYFHSVPHLSGAFSSRKLGISRIHRIGIRYSSYEIEQAMVFETEATQTDSTANAITLAASFAFDI
jgi:hypothetical protein